MTAVLHVTLPKMICLQVILRSISSGAFKKQCYHNPAKINRPNGIFGRFSLSKNAHQAKAEMGVLIYKRVKNEKNAKKREGWLTLHFLFANFLRYSGNFLLSRPSSAPSFPRFRAFAGFFLRALDKSPQLRYNVSNRISRNPKDDDGKKTRGTLRTESRRLVRAGRKPF